MRRSVVDVSCFAFMLGVGEQYFPAFVLALSLGEVASGLIATVPPAVGAMLQLATPWIVGKLGSHRRWVVWTAGLQAASFIPLAIGAACGYIPAWLLFVVACVYFGSGLAGGVAWSTWIATIAPRRIQARWFGLRTRALQITNLAGFLLAGWVLALSTGGKPIEEITDRRGVLLTFAGLFLVAAAARGWGTVMLARQAEPAPIHAGTRRVPIREFLARAVRTGGPEGRGIRLLCYMFAARSAEYIAAPFVNPYLLKELETPYQAYAFMVAAVMLGKACTFTLWGRLAQRYGPERVLWTAGLAVIPLGWLWLISTNPWWLLGLQVFSGAVWAGWELSTWLLTLRHLRDDERTSLMSLYMAGNWGSIAAGSLIGGTLLAHFGRDADAYGWVFHASSAARLLTIPVLLAVLGWPGRLRRKPRQAKEPIATGPSFDAESRGVGPEDQ